MSSVAPSSADATPNRQLSSRRSRGSSPLVQYYDDKAESRCISWLIAMFERPMGRMLARPNCQLAWRLCVGIRDPASKGSCCIVEMVLELRLC
jgi:hypothetical protein